jgi:hypothetical protein
VRRDFDTPVSLGHACRQQRRNHSPLGSQRRQKRFRFHQIKRVKPFGEPAVDRRQGVVGLGSLARVAPKPCESAQRESSGFASGTLSDSRRFRSAVDRQSGRSVISLQSSITRPCSRVLWGLSHIRANSR